VADGKGEAVHGVALEVEEGSIVSVIGPNGAGKTTLLGAVMGMLPARGSIVDDGRSIGRLTVEQRVAEGLVLVPEKRELFGSMSVEDSLTLGAFARMRRDRHAMRALDDVYARFPRLRERRAQDAGTLSGGERQMLAVARAMLAGPKLLMLDEPSEGLAPMVVKGIAERLHAMRGEGIGVLLTEQNHRLALDVADRVYFIEKGQAVWHGTAGQAAAPEVIERYLAV
jgi:branched-chain amino acid transport system ATP-binding protein